MSIKKQFRVKNSLDQVLQLIHMSTHLFSTFEFDQEFGLLEFKDPHQYSTKEQIELLTYFLDLVEYFSNERIFLIQDPKDEFRYTMTGITGGI